ncbi:hypothetical protein BDP27DRAFT_1451366 [Rhodocollybia butyracea]|uniref:ZZ-type domain-containing protein n=1 Tax=Rhodocollybia butyracea TaxID=206335 RepID=A0A9P5PHA8_9AGAR|nr:hypothetical protein BDP27DRAFT_1451366 [Rhodocollybia butyracea]
MAQASATALPLEEVFANRFSLEQNTTEEIYNSDIRKLWRQNNWGNSVKSEEFVKALQEFCVDRLSKRAHHADATTNFQGDGIDGIAHYESENDEWCLQYLTKKYEREIMEAFDSDNTGFIEISDVNKSTKILPESWTMPQIMSYYAQGWSIETAIYSRKIFALLAEMRHVCEDVLVDNARMMLWFMQSSWCAKVSWLILGAAEKHTMTQVSNPLDNLVVENMTGTQERIRQSLRRFVYIIDKPDSVEMITGPGRFEQTLLPLLYVFLQHQHAIMEYAKDHVYPNTPVETKGLYDLGFYVGYVSLCNIEHAIDARVQSLKDSPLYQEQHPAIVSDGLYAYCLNEEVPIPHGIEFISTEWSLPPNILGPEPEHDPFVPVWAEGPAVTDFVWDLEPSSTPESAEENTMDSFYRLTIADLRTVEYNSFWCDDGHGSGFISEEERKELDALREQIPVEVQNNCMTRAKTAIRKSREHLGTYCDICDVYPIQGIRLKCMFCIAFDLCSSCDAAIPPTFNTAGGDVHMPWHPMLLISRPTIRFEHDLFYPFRKVAESPDKPEKVDVPGPASNSTLNEYTCICTHCERSSDGIRYLYLAEPGLAKYMCTECYAALHSRYDIDSLPKEYRQILRFTLPSTKDDAGQTLTHAPE